MSQFSFSSYPNSTGEIFEPKRSKAKIFLYCSIIIAVIITGYNYLSDFSTFKHNKMGVVNVEGVILESDKIIDWIETLRKDDSVSGVLIRINSPGGGVAPSQEIYFAVKRLAAEKKVVVSMSTVAASGGYYIAIPAHVIVANPATLTGSIGVIMELPNVGGLLGMLGISYETLASGNLKGAGSVDRALSPEERAYFMGIIKNMNEQFVSAIAAERKLNPEELKAVNDGRALTGEQALPLKLIDKLGDKEDALEILHTLCGENERLELLVGPVEEISWLKELVQSGLNIPEIKQEIVRFLQSLNSMLKRPGFYY